MFNNVFFCLFSQWKLQYKSTNFLLICFGFLSYFKASYVKNLLQITKYLPDLRSKILELVIDNLITIDVSEFLPFTILYNTTLGSLYANMTNF